MILVYNLLALLSIFMNPTIDNKEYSIAELEQIRSQQLDILNKDKGNANAICELVCANALLCEAYCQDFGPQWRNAELCREICRYIPSIIDETPDSRVMAENVCERAAEHLFDHPRLKVRLLSLQRDAIIEQGGERAEDAEMGIDELSAKMMQMQLNIIAADQERWNDIVNEGYLKSDPIEWSEDYERVISDAQAKADERLKDVPRGMGFCYSWWHELAEILLNDYDIRWRSPKVMNPGVMFD